MDQLSRTGLPHARTLLLLACCFADAPLPYEDMFDPAVLCDSELLSAITPAEVLRAVRGLEELGLITVTPSGFANGDSETALLTLHPVVRTAGRAHPDLADGSGPYWRLAVKLLIAVADRAEDSRSGIRTWAYLSEHAAATLGLDSLRRSKEARRTADRDLARRISALRSGSRQLADNGRHVQALGVYDALLKLQQDRYGNRHAAVIATRNDRARVLREMGRHVESVEELDAILDAITHLHGSLHPDVLIVSETRARVLREMGRHEEALTEFSRLLRIVSDVYGARHDRTLTVRHEHARALQEMGRYREAVAAFDDIMRQWGSLHEPSHLFVLTTRHERARALQKAGENVLAVAEFDAILALLGSSNDVNREYFVAVSVSRALATAALGKNVEALAELDMVLERYRQHPAVSSASILGLRMERAKVLHLLGHEADALVELDAVHQELIKNFGAAHPRTRESMALATLIRNRMSSGNRPE